MSERIKKCLFKSGDKVITTSLKSLSNVFLNGKILTVKKTVQTSSGQWYLTFEECTDGNIGGGIKQEFFNIDRKSRINKLEL